MDKNYTYVTVRVKELTKAMKRVKAMSQKHPGIRFEIGPKGERLILTTVSHNGDDPHMHAKDSIDAIIAGKRPNHVILLPKYVLESLKKQSGPSTTCTIRMSPSGLAQFTFGGVAIESESKFTATAKRVLARKS